MSFDVVPPCDKDFLLFSPFLVGHPLKEPLASDFDLLVSEAVNVFGHVDQVVPMDVVVELLKEDDAGDVAGP